MGESGSGKNGIENQEPNYKGYVTKNTGKFVTEEGNLENNNILNPRD